MDRRLSAAHANWMVVPTKAFGSAMKPYAVRYAAGRKGPTT